MKRLIIFALLIGGVLGVAALTRPQAPLPDAAFVANGMRLPQDYRETFVQYARVDRVDEVTRNLYIQPEALAALESGAALPDGTQIIIEAFDAAGRDAQGRFIAGNFHTNVHMAEKRESWSLTDLPVSARVGDWNFASFDAQTFAATDENLNDCFTCHDSSATPRRDFIFSRHLLDAYDRDDTTQYLFCGLPDRLPCRR